MSRIDLKSDEISLFSAVFSCFLVFSLFSALFVKILGKIESFLEGRKDEKVCNPAGEELNILILVL